MMRSDGHPPLPEKPPVHEKSPACEYPPVHEKKPEKYTFDRLDMLWARYPQYREKTTFCDLETLLEEHESYREDFEDVREEYEAGQYERFLVQLSWQDLPYRYETRKLAQAAEMAGGGARSADGTAGGGYTRNSYVEAFLAQFAEFDTARKACFLFPESYVSQFFVVMEVCRRAEVLRPVRSLLPDEEKVHYLAVFDKRDMDAVLLMFHLLYTNPAQEVFGGYSLYDYSLPWYQTHLWENGTVLRSPYLPDRTAKFQGNLPFYHNPAKTVYVRRNIAHMLESGYFSSELELFLCLTTRLMPYFQWWYEDIARYEEKDGYRSDWRMERTKIRTELTAQGVIRPKWKHELSLFHAVRALYPETLYQYRPQWLGRQSIDLYIPSLKTGIEYQGIQHYAPVDFFGGEEALAQRQQLDAQKRALCEENGVRLLEWPYQVEPTEENVREIISGRA